MEGDIGKEPRMALLKGFVWTEEEHFSPGCNESFPKMIL